MNKTKVLWVVFDFVQAGGQRYVYEISKALDKEKYEIDFLKVAPMNFDTNWQQEYYYEPSIALGCKVFQIQEFSPKAVVEIGKRNLPSRAIGYTKRKLKIKTRLDLTKEETDVSLHEKLKTFFAKYDQINFSGVPVYKSFASYFKNKKSGAIIHILTAKFQDSNLYSGMDRACFYNFVSGMKENSIESELEGFTNYKFTHFNLCFETIPYEVALDNKTTTYRIAVFTRLSKMKPLDPYFYALKMLAEEGLNVELHIYGAGDPVELGITNQLKYLYIKKLVIFHGHVEDIPKLLKKNPPDILWFQAANCQPAGYAALEIAMSGLPQVLWDFMYMGHNVEMKEIFPSFIEISSFVNYNKTLMQSEISRIELGKKQRDYVLKNYSIKEHIHLIEELLDK